VGVIFCSVRRRSFFSSRIERRSGGCSLCARFFSFLSFLFGCRRRTSVSSSNCLSASCCGSHARFLRVKSFIAISRARSVNLDSRFQLAARFILCWFTRPPWTRFSCRQLLASVSVPVRTRCSSAVCPRAGFDFSSAGSCTVPWSLRWFLIPQLAP
jgi:hypothetical protein